MMFKLFKKHTDEKKVKFGFKPITKTFDVPDDESVNVDEKTMAATLKPKFKLDANGNIVPVKNAQQPAQKPTVVPVTKPVEQVKVVEENFNQNVTEQSNPFDESYEEVNDASYEPTQEDYDAQLAAQQAEIQKQHNRAQLPPLPKYPKYPNSLTENQTTTSQTAPTNLEFVVRFHLTSGKFVDGTFPQEIDALNIVKEYELALREHRTFFVVSANCAVVAVNVTCLEFIINA